MTQDDKEQIRRNYAGWALFAYGMTVISAFLALGKAWQGDMDDAQISALSGIVTLVSAFLFTYLHKRES